MTLLPPLAQASSDSPGTYYAAAGRHCNGVTKCVFAAVRLEAAIVLFGDSHAQMWLPALAPVGPLAGLPPLARVASGCPPRR